MPHYLKTEPGRESTPKRVWACKPVQGAWEPRREPHSTPKASRTKRRQSVPWNRPPRIRGARLRGAMLRRRATAPGGSASLHTLPGKRTRLKKTLVLGAVFWGYWTPSVGSPQGWDKWAREAGSY